MKKYFYLLVFVFLCFLSKTLNAQGFTEWEIRAAYIYKISDAVEWLDEEKFTKYQIAVFEDDTTMIDELQNMAKLRKIKEKPIEIVKYRDFKDIKTPQILYVNEERASAEMYSIFDGLREKNILIISDNCKTKEVVMINFFYTDDTRKNINFEINPRALEWRNIKAMVKLQLLKGKEIDVRKIYEEQKEMLKREREVTQKLKDEIEVQRKELDRQTAEIEKQKKMIEIQKSEIGEQQKKIDEQKQSLGKLSEEVQKQQNLLNEKLAILANQEKEIKKKEEEMRIKTEEIEKHNERLKNLNKEVSEQEKRIATQREILKNQDETIQEQGYAIIVFIVFLILLVFLAFFIYRSYKIKKEINKKLKEKNIAISKQSAEIQQQKEEIQSQVEQLALINKELEKLSIVASETDNAVMIMDGKGNFEWVNEGFTRLYGFTLPQLITERGDNFLTTSSNSQKTKEVFQRCLRNKESVIYESVVVTRSNEKIWVQTTVTPIMNDLYEVIKLVAIDSDISKLKEAENEIRQQSEELLAQRNELEVQKNHIELQNESIKASIRYALTIQQAILPLESAMSKVFNYFLIYRPKDIVSGDFYWYHLIPGHEGKNDKFLVGVIDCTGHGVPGAFMSMIGSRLLNEIVIEKKVHHPALMLEILNKEIRMVLKQDQSDNNDGMDVCLCLFEKIYEKDSKNIEKPKIKITFAGAKSPLFYYALSEKKVERVKSDRKPIGGIRATKHNEAFTSQEIILNEGDMVYLSSDGFIDQNNAERKRFGTQKFTEIVERIAELSVKEQKTVLEKEMAIHQHREEQRDDITILGIKL